MKPLQGWAQNIRRMKKQEFVDITDGTTSRKVQLVIQKDAFDLSKLSYGCSLKATGLVATAPNGNPEVHTQEFEVLNECPLKEDNGYPFTPKQSHTPDYGREYPHLRSRVDYMAAIFRIRHRTLMAINNVMDKNDFFNVNTPILTANDCEGAGETFKVRPDNEALLKDMTRPDVPLEDSYFDKKVYLSVSGQLHLEAMTYGLGNTYTISPAFRAENCKSPLHLSEFHMFEAEMGFVDRLDQLTDFVQTLLKETTGTILEKSHEDIALCHKKFGERSFDWLNRKWVTLSYKEAFKILQNNKDQFETVLKDDEGFSKEQEMFLVSHCKSPVFLVDWPKDTKPFYMKDSPEDSTKVAAMDLLMPEVGELVGGSLREDNYERLKSKIPPGLEWYLELRRFGGFPTAGFGIGIERYIQLLAGVKNIRDVIPFPRYPHGCKI